MDALETFAGIRIVPVVVIEEAAFAAPLAETLLGAGVGAMEITLRTPAALTAIEAVAKAVPDLLIGAGSVRRAQQVAEVASAGGKFLVSPGSSAGLLQAVDAARLPFVPGAVTATEVLQLADRGYQLVKFFPAELSGGVAKLKALSEPLPEVRFFPTGGVTAKLAPDYLAVSSVACIGGSWFVPGELLAARDLAQIAKLASAAMALGNR